MGPSVVKINVMDM